ncbi:MAG: NTP transferase domain-containing protein [Fusicatenibacter sp.]
MNIQECDILNTIRKNSFVNQRILAEESGHSLGIVNKSLRSLMQEEYLDDQLCLTEKAKKEFLEKAPKNAVILAAGFGMRMVPINTETPKGLLEVHGETLIERMIRQLQEAGIYEIYIVVGFMKEQFEYLIDEYGVELVVNTEYALKNNLHSMKRILSHLSNTYVIPCDIWCDRNPFSDCELYSWYMVSDCVEQESSVRVNRKMELVSVSEGMGGNAMIGIAYLLEKDAAFVRKRIWELCQDARYDGAFWEEALYQKDRMIVPAKVVSTLNAVEINTYEQLRELDSDSSQLRSDAIDTIAAALHVSAGEIGEIQVLKKGMTNRSFLFQCRGEKYIMRIPGEGTDRLINRAWEAAVYQTIGEKGICDEVVCLNPANGYKITKYMEGARVCNPLCKAEVTACMEKLKAFHRAGFQVDHEFDLFGQITFYESLRGEIPSVYRDYEKTKAQVFSLKSFLETEAQDKVLTHIDAVPDNFLFVPAKGGGEELRLIDWEYAGMQDPYVDIAMFGIYALYDRNKMEELIDAYFPEGCTRRIRIRIYGYISVCGLLWSNWCEYKRTLGVEFGEYSLRQYRYAKEYYRIVQEECQKLEEEKCSE